ncbi:MAG TPA: recombinase [Gammaproteobacteria bacterium]|nr:recombinase [Gammaproteobacteria bacterium]
MCPEDDRNETFLLWGRTSLAKPNNKSADADDAGHALSDHEYGIFDEHTHLPGHHYDHDHDDDFDDGPLEDNPLWQQDNIFLSTVGVDIGSSSTQVVFSQVHLERQGEALSSRYVVVDRRLLYQSPIFFTPYTDATDIDARALGSLIDQAYREADVTPHDVDIGVVLLTGEALRRQNAEGIAHVIAHKGGDFLSASAGHHMESNLAAHGSGAVELSGKESSCVLNVDIGGGTTKLALIRDGSLIQTAAFHVGGRLFVWDAQGQISRIEPRAAEVLSDLGHEIGLGDMVSDTMITALGEHLSSIIFDIVTGKQRSDARWLTNPLEIPPDVGTVIFSGGVSEYIADADADGHNDIGQSLGNQLLNALNEWKSNIRFEAARGGIRATALGASEFNIQVSGNTGHLSDPGLLLPRKNMPVIRLTVDAGNLTSDDLKCRLIRSVTEFDLTDYEEFALAFEWLGDFDYELLKRFCDSIVGYIESDTEHRDSALYLLFDRDLAQSVGRILTTEYEIGRPLLVLDGLRFKEFEFVDLGRIRLPSRTVPVTVKSLIFQGHGMS